MPDENDIRAALRVLAQDAPEPGTVLAAVLATPPAKTSRGRAPHWRKWAAPLAAATAVGAIVVAASLAVGTSGHRARGALQRRGLPPYYVAIMSPPHGPRGVAATVRDTKTGSLLATLNPPKGWKFIDAGPGPNEDSFLLAAFKRYGQTKVYLLRINPANHRTRLIRLSIPALPAESAVVMSPGGTEVAVAVSTAAGSQLRIYAMSGRLIRQWRGPIGLCMGQVPCLSWAASGYLGFVWLGLTDKASNGIRLIRDTAGSGNLTGRSRLVVPSRTSPDFVMSGNGATIAVDVQVRRSGSLAYRFEKFSVATGKLTGKFWPLTQYPTDSALALWSSWTGSTLVVAAPPPRGPSFATFGTLTDRKFTPLAAAPPGAWAAFAF
jgi:hypothetical protein